MMDKDQWDKIWVLMEGLLYKNIEAMDDLDWAERGTDEYTTLYGKYTYYCGAVETLSEVIDLLRYD